MLLDETIAIIYFFRCHNRYWFLHRSFAKRSNRLKSLHDPQDGVGRRAFGRYIQYRSCCLFGQLKLYLLRVLDWQLALVLPSKSLCGAEWIAGAKVKNPSRTLRPNQVLVTKPSRYVNIQFIDQPSAVETFSLVMRIKRGFSDHTFCTRRGLRASHSDNASNWNDAT